MISRRDITSGGAVAAAYSAFRKASKAGHNPPGPPLASVSARDPSDDNNTMQRRLGLLLILIPMIASAAFMLSDSAERARPEPAPKTLETPKSKPVERDDAQSQAPQPAAAGEVIGTPMLA